MTEKKLHNKMAARFFLFVIVITIIIFLNNKSMSKNAGILFREY